MKTTTIRQTAIACLCGLLFLALPGGAETGAEMVVQIDKKGDIFVTHVSFVVAASQAQSWQVLTDFDHMHEFISTLQSSKIVQREGNRLQVAQRGTASQGIWSFRFESVRDVELFPYHTIRTHLLNGNMKKLDGETSLQPDGDRTRITYHGESIPSAWVPPGLGEKFIAYQVRQQYEEMLAEILKRKHAADIASIDPSRIRDHHYRAAHALCAPVSYH